MSNYTEGPWRWYRNSNHQIVIETKYSFEYERAVWNSEKNCYQGTRPAKNTLTLAVVECVSQKAFMVEKAEAIANAHLIAAAPELLEALEEALPMLHTGDELPMSYYKDKPGVLGKALRAIEKAKGE